MKIKTIDNVIYADIPQWKPKQKEESFSLEWENFLSKCDEICDEGRMEEAMIEWNKKR